MPVTGIDHVAFPTSDHRRLVDFYSRLGFTFAGLDEYGQGSRHLFAITCGDNKLNVHPETLAERRGESWYLRAPAAEPGCADVCFVWEGGLQSLLELLEQAGVEPITSPVARTGGRAVGTQPGVSVYVRDPDENLLEFISYDPADLARWSDQPRSND